MIFVEFGCLDSGGAPTRHIYSVLLQFVAHAFRQRVHVDLGRRVNRKPLARAMTDECRSIPNEGAPFVLRICCPSLLHCGQKYLGKQSLSVAIDRDQILNFLEAHLLDVCVNDSDVVDQDRDVDVTQLFTVDFLVVFGGVAAAEVVLDHSRFDWLPRF